MGRGFSNYQAALTLLRRGMAPQALMLARPLFEDVIAGLWAALPQNRGSVFDLVAEKDSHQSRVLLRTMSEIASRQGWVTESDEEWDVSDESLDRKFGKASQKNWFGKLSDAVGEVKGLFVELGGEEDALDWSFKVSNSIANSYLHSTPAGLAVGARGSTTSSGRTAFGYGEVTEPPEGEMLRAIELPTTFFALLIETGIQLIKGEQSRPFLDAQNAFRVAMQVPPLDPSPRRNDLCPCGSRSKYKHCHGR
jgi:hypothetical protein